MTLMSVASTLIGSRTWYEEANARTYRSLYRSGQDITMSLEHFA